MRKLIITLLTITSLTLAFGGATANAGCVTLNEQSSAGSLTGQVCITSSSVSLDNVVLMVAATGKTYTINGTGTVSGTVGHYTVTGTVTITDGTNSETINISTSGSNLIIAATGFINRTITIALQH
jgi:hypothetical protein